MTSKLLNRECMPRNVISISKKTRDEPKDEKTQRCGYHPEGRTKLALLTIRYAKRKEGLIRRFQIFRDLISRLYMDLVIFKNEWCLAMPKGAIKLELPRASGAPLPKS